MFRSVPELVSTIKDDAATHKANPTPFFQTAKASGILQKVIRANQRLSFKFNEALRPQRAFRMRMIIYEAPEPFKIAGIVRKRISKSRLKDH